MIKNNNDYYNKIRGWNFFEVFTFLLVFPIAEIINSYVQYTTTIEHFNYVKGLKEYVTICIISSLILLIISLWCGISLIRLKTYAVKLIKVFLILILINGTLQETYTIISNLDKNYKFIITDQITTNIKFSAFFFTVWFTYFIFSDPIDKKVYIKKEYENIEKKKDFHKINISFNLIVHTLNFFKKLKNRLNLLDKSLNNLKLDLIIIISLIIATTTSVSLGLMYGETNYYLYQNGGRVDKNYPPHTYEEFNFNYLISLTSFILIGGLTYIYLKTKSKNEKNI